MSVSPVYTFPLPCFWLCCSILPEFSSPTFLFVSTLFKVLVRFYILCREFCVYPMNNFKKCPLHPWALGTVLGVGEMPMSNTHTVDFSLAQVDLTQMNTHININNELFYVFWRKRTWCPEAEWCKREGVLLRICSVREGFSGSGVMKINRI